ncbi:dihydrolipoamide dehydrogenase [Tamlana sedimentorum]|uniref:Dihydrolipoamide dehydrogenase n=1 Tax=Neotamlana sedimentorum TaxID=1435349 RepID=A0A0D7WAM3_9FLAO|nr:DUF2911 domain-containing protein [Tamlana sedimentorum]KJD36124.1 dihydrolipoamide dehydrogenase [Tamlana sedimentorum]
MKKLLLALAIFAMVFSASAQIKTPAPSPFSKLEQKVGLTDVSIEYSRPGVKDRVIFGDVVPFGKLWRTGANARTKITFSTDVTIADKPLKAGTYAILSVPGKESWDIIFYTEYDAGGAPAELDESKVALTVTGKVYPVPFNVESFTIDLNSLRNSSATLEFIWEKTYVSVPLGVPTDAAVEKSIEAVMAGPSANDYQLAAQYYLNEGKDISKAKEWIDKAVEKTGDKTPFWFLRRKALIYAKAGDKKGAIEAAKLSLEGAKKAGNADYVKMNEASLKEWGAK